MLLASVLALAAVLYSALPWLLSLPLAVLVALLAGRRIRRELSSRWQALIIDVEQGHALVDADGSSVDCNLVGHGRAGPWLMLRLRDEAGRVHEFALREAVLGETPWRRLSTLLRLLSDDELLGQTH